MIPARLGSTRMPQKMLRRETGRYLFEHTVRAVERSSAVERVVVATDAEEILSAAEEVGIEALLTSAAHQSGTDRVHEAWRLIAEREGADFDVVLNVQGDEPELPPADLDVLVAAFDDPETEIATLCTPIATREEVLDPAVVKVVRDAAGFALYFSRSPVPSLDHPSRPMRPGAPGLQAALRHVGVYAFRPAALQGFCGLPYGALEATENLEQLRWLEAGRRMRVLDATRPTYGIDTEEDYAAFVARQDSNELIANGTEGSPTR
ncbi:MAG: 3-deoxy-manno-octulosonate cytidylyltransferase [Planctomycetota bacterium]|nr:3-deoxy-manno-octulosonate cytidylyltransferase [Planctomycetota bacterium]